MYAVDSLQKDASVSSLKRNFVWGVLEGRNHVDKECCVIPHLMLSEGETVDGRSLHLPDGRDPRGIYSSFKSQKDPKTTIFAGPINVSEAYKLLKIVHLLDISKLQNHAMFNRVNEKSHFNFKNEDHDLAMRTVKLAIQVFTDKWDAQYRKIVKMTTTTVDLQEAAFVVLRMQICNAAEILQKFSKVRLSTVDGNRRTAALGFIFRGVVPKNAGSKGTEDRYLVLDTGEWGGVDVSLRTLQLLDQRVPLKVLTNSLNTTHSNEIAKISLEMRDRSMQIQNDVGYVQSSCLSSLILQMLEILASPDNTHFLYKHKSFLLEQFRVRSPRNDNKPSMEQSMYGDSGEWMLQQLKNAPLSNIHLWRGGELSEVTVIGWHAYPFDISGKAKKKNSKGKKTFACLLSLFTRFVHNQKSATMLWKFVKGSRELGCASFAHNICLEAEDHDDGLDSTMLPCRGPFQLHGASDASEVQKLEPWLMSTLFGPQKSMVELFWKAWIQARNSEQQERDTPSAQTINEGRVTQLLSQVVGIEVLTYYNSVGKFNKCLAHCIPTGEQTLEEDGKAFGGGAHTVFDFICSIVEANHLKPVIETSIPLEFDVDGKATFACNDDVSVSELLALSFELDKPDKDNATVSFTLSNLASELFHGTSDVAAALLLVMKQTKADQKEHTTPLPASGARRPKECNQVVTPEESDNNSSPDVN
jgi:hypothetical protein